MGSDPEIVWFSTQDAREYLDDWFVGILIEFVNSSYAVDEEAVENLIHQAADQSV